MLEMLAEELRPNASMTYPARSHLRRLPANPKFFSSLIRLLINL
jgi:hypothetical protein